MKSIYIKFISIVSLVLYSGVSFADTFEVDGICYETDASNSGIAIVTSNPSNYSGSITIPASVTYNGATLQVTTIGRFAFSGSSRLSSVTLPSSLTKIESFAFYMCSSLNNISLPASLVNIGDDAFSSTGLESIIIPRGVTEIGESVFSGCKNLTVIQVEEGNEVFDSRENCNAIIKGNVLVCGCNNTTIPSGIAVIAKSAFSSLSITSISIPNTVTSINNFAFSNCRKLTSISLPSSLTKIESCAFYMCSALTAVSLPNSLNKIGDDAFSSTGLESIAIPKSVTSIGESIFSGCRNLTNIIVEEGNEVYDSRNNCNAIIQKQGAILIAGCITTKIPIGVKVIARSAFSSLYLTSIELPNTITTIGSFAFSNCGKLTEIILPESLTKIDSYAFYSCSKLSKIESRISNPFEIEDNVFSVYEKAVLYVPSGTVSNYQGAKGWQKFSNIQEQSTPVVGIFEVAGIYYYPIEGTDKVKVVSGKEKYSGAINIPATVLYYGKTYQVTSIAEKAFQTCSDLNSVKMASAITAIGNYAFQGCDNLNSIELSESLVEIGDGAFEGTGINSILIPKAVTTIGKGILIGCDNLAIIRVESGNSVYNSWNNCNAILRNNTLIAGCKTTKIPDGIEIIGDDAFNSCIGLKSLDFPNTITLIKDRAFYGCEELATIHLSNNLMAIGNSAFEKTGITTLSIPKRVNSISATSFANCKQLSSIQVEDGNSKYDSRENCNAIVETVQAAIVLGCKSTKIISSIQKIKENAFRYCDITSITLPSGIIALEDNAFNGCNSLIEVFSEIKNPFDINSNVFSNINRSAALYVPAGTIDAYKQKSGWTFSLISELSDPDISFDSFPLDGINYDVDKSDRNKVSVSSISNPYLNVATIPETVRYKNKEMRVNAVGSTAFSATNVKIVVLPNTITSIGEEAFKNSGLMAINIPSSVTSLGKDIFVGCNDLCAIDYQTIGTSTKEYNELISDVIDIKNPNLLLYIPNAEFVRNGIRNVVIGEQAKSIILEDAGHGNFYCPRAFTAGNITYTHNYSLPTEKGKCQGWESIVLPFDVQTIKTANGETIKPVSVAGTGEKRFWLRELKDSGFSESDGIKANVPYIISMPNWDGYQDFYNISGDVTFSAQDVAIQPSDNLQISTSGHYQFVPNYQVQEKSAEYLVLNSEAFVENGTSYAPGSAFKAELRNVHPFEAYLTNDGAATVKRYISIADLMGVTTSVSDIPGSLRRAYSDNGTLYVESVADGSCNIYSLSGLLTRTLSLKRGLNSIAGLTKGIYIVNGQKVLVQ